jgi:hypothetical protein
MAGTTGLEPAASAVTVAGFEYFQRQPKFGGFAILNCQFGWLRGSRKLLKRKDFLVAGGGFVPFFAFPRYLSSSVKHGNLLITFT